MLALGRGRTVSAEHGHTTVLAVMSGLTAAKIKVNWKVCSLAVGLMLFVGYTSQSNKSIAISSALQLIGMRHQLVAPQQIPGPTEGHFKMMAGFCPSVCLSVACLDLTRERKGLRNTILAGWKHITRETREPEPI